MWWIRPLRWWNVIWQKSDLLVALHQHPDQFDEALCQRVVDLYWNERRMIYDPKGWVIKTAQRLTKGEKYRGVH